ncbi:MAG: energy transducer TonB [Gemmatimonadota bacterium]|nr:energy transducer TonB [Gemmatimonadota bacterium]MDH3369229.1 energy transducer TonB [Gemmatimonadota bacterium]MDH3479330.1 energy transducer TonB [Gemmatimonadota bacterium]MDH3571167.1 energy transducer TonB [Gemmatimonadota bacterium]MDH5548821.1 energy transducer TonB [Gemmatimonadota bacterium]
MLTVLTESGRRRGPVRSSLPGTFASLAWHAGAIGTLVVVTLGPPPAPAPIPLLIAGYPTFGPAVPDHPAPPLPDIAILGPAPGIAVPSFEVPKGIPPIDLTDPTIPLLPRPGSDARAVTWGVPGATGAGGTNPLYESNVVDDPPKLLSAPGVPYPTLLREAGIEGTVLAEVVLDTLGRAEAATFTVVAATHRAFEGPAREVVLGSLYRPGRVQGRAVRVIVRLPIAFRIDRPS